MSSTNRPNSSAQLPPLQNVNLPAILSSVERHLREDREYRSAMELMQEAQAQGKHLSGAQALRQIRSKTK